MASSEFFWRAVLLHCRKIMRIREMRPPVFQTASVDFVSFGGSGSCPTVKFRRGSNRALQKFPPNEFGAQEVRHQPLAKASGMVSCKRLILQGCAFALPRNFRRLITAL